MNRNVKSDSIPNQMYLFIGVNESKKEKYVVVDANNNHDFSDDRLYTFSLPDEPLTREEKEERAVALQITPDPNKRDTVSIGIDPFNYFDFNYGQDKRLSVIIVFTEYMQAQALIDGKPVEIFADNSDNLFQRDLSERLSCKIFYTAAGYGRTGNGKIPIIGKALLQVARSISPTCRDRRILSQKTFLSWSVWYYR